MQLTQIEGELIDAAHSQGQVEPATFARLLLHDLGDVETAISGLINRGVLAAEDTTYRLTDQGEAVHQTQEKAHRAVVGSRTRSWQRR